MARNITEPLENPAQDQEHNQGAGDALRNRQKGPVDSARARLGEGCRALARSARWRVSFARASFSGMARAACDVPRPGRAALRGTRRSAGSGGGGVGRGVAVPLRSWGWSTLQWRTGDGPLVVEILQILLILLILRMFGCGNRRRQTRAAVPQSLPSVATGADLISSIVYAGSPRQRRQLHHSTLLPVAVGFCGFPGSHHRALRVPATVSRCGVLPKKRAAANENARRGTPRDNIQMENDKWNSARRPPRPPRASVAKDEASKGRPERRRTCARRGGCRLEAELRPSIRTCLLFNGYSSSNRHYPDSIPHYPVVISI
eukprot:gene16966-biopygen11905